MSGIDLVPESTAINADEHRYRLAVAVNQLIRSLDSDSSAALDTLFDAKADRENGFVDRADSEISFTDGTRTFSIEPTGTSFAYYVDGVSYTKSAQETLVIADTEGMHYIYYDGASLTSATTFSAAIITDYAFCAAVYWDADNQEAIFFGDERHGNKMDSATHIYNHLTFGTRYGSGLGIAGITADGDGDDDVHAQLSVANGSIWDEDLQTVITNGSPQTLSPVAQIPLFYRSGASGDWRRIAATNFPITTTGTGRAAWNEWTGATWQLSEVGNLDWVCVHIVATSDVRHPIVGIVGQAEYGTLTDVRDGAETELASLQLGPLDTIFPEFLPIATVVFRTSNTYANTVKSLITTTWNTEGDEYISWLGLLASSGAVGGSVGAGVPVGGTTGQVLAKASATDYDTEWVAASGGSSMPLAILGKTSAVSQNVGGANGTEVWWTWDSQVKLDTGFTHSTTTNSERIQVDADGWYEIAFVGSAQTTGSSRTTLQGIYRINGGTTSRRGTVRSYTRGAVYGNCSPQLFATVQLTSGDYIELGTRVEDTDATYTINTTGAEIDDDSHYLQIKKIA